MLAERTGGCKVLPVTATVAAVEYLSGFYGINKKWTSLFADLLATGSSFLIERLVTTVLLCLYSVDFGKRYIRCHALAVQRHGG